MTGLDYCNSALRVPFRSLTEFHPMPKEMTMRYHQIISTVMSAAQQKILACACGILLVAGGLSAIEEPLVNSGFEDGLTGWETSGTVQLETSGPIHGKQSLRLGPGAASIRQRCTMDNSGHLFFRAMLKGASAQAGRVDLRFLDRQGKEVMAIHSSELAPDKNWPGFTACVYQRPHPLTASLEVTISTDANDGPVLVDEVIVTNYSTASHAPQCDLNQYMQPFWKGRTVYNETVLLVADQGGLATGRLLFTPTKIISVRNSALDKTYEINRDFTVSQRTLTATANSSITQMKTSDFPTGDFPWYKAAEKQVVVTYEHDDAWTGPTPTFAGASLPSTMKKLQAHAPLHVVAYGDSITFGLDVSRIRNVPPYMPTWSELFVHRLKTVFKHQNISLFNIAESGKNTEWAVRMQERMMAGLDADLVILSFGMNEFWGVSPADFKSRIATIMAKVRATRPDAEFLLVSAMCYDPEYTSNPDYLSRQAAYPGVLNELCGSGVEMVDLTAISAALYAAKKPKDCVSDPMHPNDYLARWYAQGLVALLEAPETVR